MAEREPKDKKKHRGMFFELDYGEDIKLDLKDKKIISLLGENCRISSTNIGKLVRSSKDSVRYRIKQLIEKDVYRGNVTILNPFILGFPVYSLLIKLKSIAPNKEEKIIDFFENHPFIIWAGKTQGIHDFDIVMTAKDINHFDKLLKEIQIKLSNNIEDLKVLHMSKMYSCNTVPLEFQKKTEIITKTGKNDSSFSAILKNPYCHNQEEKIKLSMKEILILKEVANNANMSLQDISEKTKIKPDTVKNKLRGFIQRNIILAFRAAINVSFLRYHGYIAYFKLHPATKDAKRKEFEDFFINSSHIAFGTSASGSHYDSIIYIFSQNPLDFNNFINDIRNKFSDIIEEYATDLILKDYKFTFFPEGLLTPIKSLIVKIGGKFEL